MYFTKWFSITGSLLLMTLFMGCRPSVKKLVITEAEIDEYVSSRLDPAEIYDITPGLRYSKDVGDFLETYEVVGYEQKDSLILYTEQVITAEKEVNRNTFFKEELPVYVEEYTVWMDERQSPFEQRKAYLNGAEVIAAYERKGMNEEELEEKAYDKTAVAISEFDFDNPKQALLQQGAFEMKFGEFLIMPQSQYLVLENKESGYNIALLILQDDELLNELFQHPDDYHGKTIFVTHHFMTLNNVNQMIYDSGVVVEEKE